MTLNTEDWQINFGPCTRHTRAGEMHADEMCGTHEVFNNVVIVIGNKRLPISDRETPISDCTQVRRERQIGACLEI
jgi:hypothetical protein